MTSSTSCNIKLGGAGISSNAKSEENTASVVFTSTGNHDDSLTIFTGQAAERDELKMELNSSAAEDERLKSYYFGCGPFHPKCLQIFASKKLFTFMMFVFILIQGSVVIGYESVNISSLEKRYSFSSVLAGVYVIMYDVFLSIGIIFISYFGGKSHKPRFMGISLIIMSVGSIVIASPQFFFGSYKSNNRNSDSAYEQCSLDAVDHTDMDDSCTPANIGAYIILLVGQALLAIGAASAKTVAIAYIDEIVHPKYVSLHLGVVLIANIIGPAIGYVLGSAFLSIYVDPWTETDLNPHDQAWVGAWWIGPLITGIFGIFFSILFFMFPKWLPDSYEIKMERTKEMAKIYTSNDVDVNEDNRTLAVKQFPIQIKHLLTNPSFMTTSFGLAMLYIVQTGIITFGPKYTESMFNLTASTAAVLPIIAVVGGVIGAAIGALAVYFWKPVGRQTAVIHTVIIALTIPFVLVFLIKCPTVSVAGITVPYADGSFDGRDSSMCSMNCSCQSSVYEPVCGDDGITYFSPCRAGCTTVYTDENLLVFENCSCVGSASPLNITDSEFSLIHNSTVVEGSCSYDCDRLIPYAILYFILILSLLIIEIPFYHFTLRVVADEQRPLALGLQSAIYRVFGTIPGPLLFGAIIDLACVEWDYNCGVRGNCWIYNNDKLSLNSTLLFLPFVIFSAILLFVGFVTYPTRKHEDNDKQRNTSTN